MMTIPSYIIPKIQDSIKFFNNFIINLYGEDEVIVVFKDSIGLLTQKGCIIFDGKYGLLSVLSLHIYWIGKLQKLKEILLCSCVVNIILDGILKSYILSGSKK